MIEDALANPEMIKAVLPKSVDEIFDIFESIVPGSKDLQKPIIECLDNTAPLINVSGKLLIYFKDIFQEIPVVFKKLIPTLTEMFGTVEGGESGEKNYAKWGKALEEVAGPLARSEKSCPNPKNQHLNQLCEFQNVLDFFFNIFVKEQYLII